MIPSRSMLRIVEATGFSIAGGKVTRPDADAVKSFQLQNRIDIAHRFPVLDLDENERFAARAFQINIQRLPPVSTGAAQGNVLGNPEDLAQDAARVAEGFGRCGETLFLRGLKDIAHLVELHGDTSCCEIIIKYK